MDPMRVTSLPLDLSRTYAPKAGEWEASFTVGYFNQLSNTWHIAAIQKELGREGEILRPDLLRLAELRHGKDAIFHLDLEGHRTELSLAYGVGRGFGFSLTVPWMDIGSPNWDAISSDFHSWIGLSQNDRLVVQRGQSHAYLHDDGLQLEAFNLAGSGLGDTTLAVSGPGGQWFRATHRWALAVEMPTGDRDTLFGSGGWDVGVQWTGSWLFTHSRLDLVASYSFLDSSGSWLGIERSDLASIATRYTREFRRIGGISLEIRFDDAPIADATDGELGDVSFVTQIGWRRNLGDRHWLGFVFGNNFPVESGVQPDLTLALQIGAR